MSFLNDSKVAQEIDTAADNQTIIELSDLQLLAAAGGSADVTLY